MYEEGAAPIHEQEFTDQPEEKILKSFDQRIAAEGVQADTDRALINDSIEDIDLTEQLVRSFAVDNAIEPI